MIDSPITPLWLKSKQLLLYVLNDCIKISNRKKYPIMTAEVAGDGCVCTYNALV